MREMMLKMGKPPRSWSSIPRIRSVTLTIDVRQDTCVGKHDRAGSGFVCMCWGIGC